MEKPKVKIVFAEGAFDGIAEDMTQEEVDELVAEIHRLAESGSLFEDAVPLEDEDEIDYIIGKLEKRNVQ
jgi:hypothetical protein